ncbi:MAG TPA: thioredoxin domain-containing protein, partial [Baekduia sp.]|nr:thioredoxin domain-containing protein [Baekduia sp.]
MANALAHESSPYLLQHKDNPVDWLPWGEAAFERAREQDKPLLISIGYSACHWCHVMERESFEDEQTAALMNEHFVCVKVDREERPDIDAIYMEAVQAMTGHGGWPLNVFIAPDQTPFYGGTYFPPQRRHGLPSWGDVLYSLATAWTQQREEIRANGEELSARLARSAALSPVGATPAKHALDDAVRNLAGSYDELHGGFGTTPKFPPSCVLGYLLTQAVSESAWSDQARSMTLETLRKM